MYIDVSIYGIYGFFKVSSRDIGSRRCNAAACCSATASWSHWYKYIHDLYMNVVYIRVHIYKCTCMDSPKLALELFDLVGVVQQRVAVRGNFVHEPLVYIYTYAIHVYSVYTYMHVYVWILQSHLWSFLI